MLRFFLIAKARYACSGKGYGFRVLPSPFVGYPLTGPANQPSLSTRKKPKKNWPGLSDFGSAA
jgi:hypothetical protein